jgi:hypothetical protein
MLKQYRSTRAIPACVTVDVTSCVERTEGAIGVRGEALDDGRREDALPYGRIGGPESRAASSPARSPASPRPRRVI